MWLCIDVFHDVYIVQVVCFFIYVAFVVQVPMENSTVITDGATLFK